MTTQWRKLAVRTAMNLWAMGLMLPAMSLAEPATGGKPVKVYIMSGQSNMVGIGQVTSESLRWDTEMQEPTLSVYAGDYDPKADYDQLTPTQTLKLEKFGGVEPTPYPGGGTQVVRGFLQNATTGVYMFHPGYDEGAHNVMVVNGQEVYRKEVGSDAKQTTIKLSAGERVPFKITYLTKSANGLGWTSRVDVPGTLRTLVMEQGKFPHLRTPDGGWAVRDDVWYRGVVTATGNKWLSVGCGASPGMIGPELGFGWVMGDYHEEPVLLLKASQGNRSLGWDFLPPGSERFEANGYVYAGYKDTELRWAVGTEPKKDTGWYAGKQYDECFQAAHEVLKNFDANFPHWAGRGYEIVGFVWWQGHKDTGDDVHAARYEHNLAKLIEALRKEFNAPNAKFVVGVGCGNEGREGRGLTIAQAQLAVDGDTGKHPQFKGNVKTVDTRDFIFPPEQSPKNQGFHYNQNAQTYYLVGQALGNAMKELHEGPPTK